MPVRPSQGKKSVCLRDRKTLESLGLLVIRKYLIITMPTDRNAEFSKEMP